MRSSPSSRSAPLSVSFPLDLARSPRLPLLSQVSPPLSFLPRLFPSISRTSEEGKRGDSPPRTGRTSVRPGRFAQTTAGGARSRLPMAPAVRAGSPLFPLPLPSLSVEAARLSVVLRPSCAQRGRASPPPFPLSVRQFSLSKRWRSGASIFLFIADVTDYWRPSPSSRFSSTATKVPVPLSSRRVSSRVPLNQCKNSRIRGRL